MIPQPILYVVLFAWGLAVKYWPKLAKVPNDAIPWMNMVIGLLNQIRGPEAAHADVIAIGGTLGAVAGWFAPVLAAGADSLKTALFYKFFGEHAVERWIGLRPNSPPFVPRVNA